MRVFEKTEQITNRSTYKAAALSGLKKVGGAPEKFLYVEKFKFTNGEGPLLLVGEVSKDLLADIKSAMKTPAVEGKLKRSAASELVFAPAKGTLAANKADAAIKDVGGKDSSTVGKLDSDEDSVSRAKDDREAELEKLRNTNEKSGFQNRKEDAKSAVTNMLQNTGRSEAPDIRDAKRDQMSGQILGQMEKSVNERNAVLFPDKPEAHHVTAHGPGTDQVSRLVTGHRNDEILKDQSKGALPTMKLSGNAAIGDATVPVYEKVGEGASNISGAFNSNTAMLHTIEEAYSQVAQLDTYVASALKAATKVEYARVMQLPECQESLKKLQIAQKLIAQLQSDLKKPNPKPNEVQDCTSRIEKLQAGIKVEAKKLQDAVKANTVKPALDPEFGVGSERLARTVQPGTTGQKGFAEQGLGTGVEIDTALGKQAKGGDVAKDGKSKEQIMQERYDQIKTTPGQTTAKVVMDPAFVDDGKGGKRRAGWDVQTAYPVNDKANTPINQPGGAKAYVDLVKDLQAKVAEVTKSRDSEKNKKLLYEQAKKKRENAESAIKAKTERAKPAQELALKKAQDALALVPTGTEQEEKAKGLVTKMQENLDATLAAIKKSQSEIAQLKLDEDNLKGPWEAAKLELDQLVLEQEALEAQKE
jgi:hypothetical protein